MGSPYEIEVTVGPVRVTLPRVVDGGVTPPPLRIKNHSPVETIIENDDYIYHLAAGQSIVAKYNDRVKCFAFTPPPDSPA